MVQVLEFRYLCKAVDFIARNALTKKLGTSTGGEEFTQDTIDEVLELCGKSHIQGLSILGGEPMNPENIEGTGKLAKAFKEKYPEKSLWGWSGYKFEDYLSKQDQIKYFDVIVDGQFVNEKRNPKLDWKGSENQRVIDVQKSLKEQKVILYEK